MLCEYQEGQLAGEYSMPSAQCFTITPTGSGSQHLVAVGAEDRLTFLSTSDQSVVSSLDSVLKVMCMLMVDTSLFVGLGCGAVVVISLTVSMLLFYKTHLGRLCHNYSSVSAVLNCWHSAGIN